jgi:hypothetical protein
MTRSFLALPTWSLPSLLVCLLAASGLLTACEEEATSIGRDRLDAGAPGDDDDDDDMVGDDDDDDMMGDDDDDDDDGVACDRTNPCDDDEFCDVDGASCGGRLGAGTCARRPDVCTTECTGVCGCDGLSYCNDCTAQLAGVDVADDTACLGRAACDAQLVRARGDCDAIYGYYWDGTECTGLSGCSCEGADCDVLHDDVASCQRAFVECLGEDPCAAMDARAVGACDAIVGVAWNGRSCVSLSGCSCEGADCVIAERLTLEACRTLYDDCGP